MGKKDCNLFVNACNCIHKMISAYSKKRADKHKVVICTCTKFYFCTKHKITGVPKNRKFQFFLTELVSYILLILLNLAEFSRISISDICTSYTQQRPIIVIKANWPFLSLSPWPVYKFEILDLCLFLKTLLLSFSFLAHYYSNSPHILVTLPTFFPFLDPLLFPFPYFFRPNCISPLVSWLVLSSSAIPLLVSGINI